MMRLRALPEVSDDIAAAANWYRQIDVDLSVDYVEAVYASLGLIFATPLIRKPVYKEYRRGLMRRFPYVVYYRVANEELIIALIIHTARDPVRVRRILLSREKAD